MKFIKIMIIFFMLLINLAYGLDQEKLKVGAILPFSGELSYFGKAFQQGFSMGLKDTGNLIEIYYEDSKSGNRKEAISGTRKLIANNKVNFILVTGYPIALVVDSIIKNNNLISFSMWDSNQQILNLSKNTYGFGWSNEDTAKSMAEFSYKNLNLKNIAIISAQDEWSYLMEDNFSSKFKNLGGKISFNTQVKLDDTQFLSLVTKLKRLNPDGIYFPLYKSSLNSFTKQILQVNYKGALLTAEGMAEKDLNFLPNKDFSIFVTQAYLKNKNFYKKYKTTFKDKAKENLAYVAIAYDCAKYLLEMLKEIKKNNLKLTTENIKKALNKVIYKGVLGISSFKDSRVINRSQIILKAKNKKLIPVK